MSLRATWRCLRILNIVEQAFREVHRRPDVVGWFPVETATLVLISAPPAVADHRGVAGRLG